MRIVTLFFSFIIIGTIAAFAQNNRADGYYKKGEYANAIPLYLKKLKKQPGDTHAIKQLAMSYFIIKNYVDAEKNYEQLIAKPNVNPIAHFYYAEALRSNNKLPIANEQLRKYISLAPDDDRAKKEIFSLEELKAMLTEAPRYQLKTISGLPTDGSVFGAIPFKDGIVYMSNKNKDVILFQKDNWDNTSYYDLEYAYKTKEKNDSLIFKSEEKYFKKLNTAYHEGPVSVSENTLFYTSLNNSNKAMIRFSEWNESGWKKSIRLNLGNDSFSVAHPAISLDGTTLYFTSDMPGGYGGKDLYVSKKEGSGWSKPMNLGSTINTPQDELFPFITADGKLFFSSDGHEGLGRFDVFSSKKENNIWSTPVNAGQPINSTADDLCMTFDNTNKNGYFSSNRSGNDHIYAFGYIADESGMSGRILFSKNTNDPAKALKIYLLKEDGTIIQVTTTDSNGKFKFYNLPPDQNYLISVDEEDSNIAKKDKFYLTDDQGRIVAVTGVGNKNKKHVFKSLPADIAQLPLLEEVDDVSISGNILKGENPSKPVVGTMVFLLNEKGEVVDTAITNIFGSFVFTKLPPEKKFFIQVAENDPELASAKILLTDKNGKIIQTIIASAKGSFKFSFLPDDKKTLELMTVDDTELRYELQGKLLGDGSKPIINHQLKLITNSGQEIKDTYTDQEGRFIFYGLPADNTYILVLDLEDTQLKKYKKIMVLNARGTVIKEYTVNLLDKNVFRLLPEDQKDLRMLYVDDPWLSVLKMQNNKQGKKQNDQLTIIENIYYNLNDWKLLPESKPTLDKVVGVMNNNKNISIELSAHTDSRASKEYNLNLSQKRAQAAVDYIVSKGISPSRIKGLGYGENNLINRCADGVDCSEEEHAKNRRTEFKIINY